MLICFVYNLGMFESFDMSKNFAPLVLACSNWKAHSIKLDVVCLRMTLACDYCKA